MAFGWAGAAGAVNAGIADRQQQAMDLETQLAEREYRRQTLLFQQAQEERIKQQMAQQAEQFRVTQDTAAAERRQAENQRGVQAMVGEFISKNGVTPENRNQIIGTLVQAGRMPTQTDLALPEQAQSEPFTLGTGQVRFGPDGQVIARGPAPQASGGGTPDQQWVTRNGQVIPIRRGTAQPGDMPFDPVAARQTQPNDPDGARQITQQALGLAQRLKTHPGLGKAYGTYEMRGWTQDAQNAKAIRNQLLAALALPNLGALKGPMSDKDILFVKQLASRLENDNISDEEATLAVQEAITFLGSKVPVQMRAPNGDVQEVPGDQVEHFKALGAVVVQ